MVRLAARGRGARGARRAARASPSASFPRARPDASVGLGGERAAGVIRCSFFFRGSLGQKRLRQALMAAASLLSGMAGSPSQGPTSLIRPGRKRPGPGCVVLRGVGPGMCSYWRRSTSSRVYIYREAVHKGAAAAAASSRAYIARSFIRAPPRWRRRRAARPPASGVARARGAAGAPAAPCCQGPHRRATARC